MQQKNFGDGLATTPDGVLSLWSSGVGNQNLLVAQVRDFIIQSGADVILTFDPRHGTTCHPDHRAAGTLALLSAQAAGISMDSIFMVESIIYGVAGSTTTGFRPAVPSDAKTQTYSIDERWDNLIHLMSSLYKSQYSVAEVSALQSVSMENRRLSLLNAKDAVENDTKYSSLCP